MKDWDDDANAFADETNRLHALTAFLQKKVETWYAHGVLPRALAVDYDAAVAEALEAVRRIAGRS